ncbi:hypothetical protein ElyMa_000658300 [Elysia marginata]|uniref:Uncharacterized protein n=1 Tax=Elysia marginata TaxID=1093978 RepID=A0AAV4GDL0_9GAST|nr:hypothetical protein ElyMa_000658300 [Elysia marginata]
MLENPISLRGSPALWPSDSIPEDKKLLSLKGYSVSPNVLYIPGNLNLSLAIQLNKDLVGAQLDLEVKIRRHISSWLGHLTIPCIKKAGSW